MKSTDYAKRVRIILSSVLGLFLAACGFGGCALYKSIVLSEADQLEARLAEAKALGFPMVASDLNPKPPILDADNAAKDIQEILRLTKSNADVQKGYKAFQKLPFRKISDHDLLQVLGSPSPASRGRGQGERVSSGLARIEFLALQASKKTALDYHRDWDMGFWIPAPEFAVERNCVRLLSYRARLDATKGNYSAAVDHLEACMRLSDLFASEPMLISSLVSIACRFMAARQATYVASLAVDKPQVLLRIRTLYSKDPNWKNYLRALRGDYYGSLALARNIKGYGELKRLTSENPPDPPKKQDIVRQGIPKLGANQSFLSKLTYFFVKNFRSAPERIEDVSTWSKKLDLSTQNVGTDYSIGGRMMELVLPVFAAAGDAVVKDVMQSRVERTFLDILLFRQKNHRLPRDLSEIGPTPMDICSGKPLRYKLTQNGFIVYSIGTDKKDDGGDIRAGANHNKDIAVEFPPAELP